MKKTVRFDSIANSITERVDDPSAAGVSKYVGLEHLDPESIEISRWGAPEEVSATKLRFYIGDVIYGRRRAYQKKLGVARFEGICSAHALVLRAREEKCLPRFLPYFLLSDQFHNRALEISVGSLSPTINWSTLRQQQFELPSLEEQAHIVELLSAVDEHAEALRTQLNVAQETRKSVLHEFLSAGGDDWTETTLGEVAKWGSGGTPKSGASDYYDGDIPWCVIGDLTEGEVFYTEKCITGAGLKNSSAKIVEPGAVMIAMYGASIGRTGIVGRPMATNQAIAFAYPDVEMLDNQFLLLFLQTQKLQLVAAGQGAAQPNISQNVLKTWPLTLPPLDEQERIVEEISKIDVLIDETSASLNSTKQLRTSLLNKEIA